MVELSKAIKCMEQTVMNYRKFAKQFYFEVLFSKYRCPQCVRVMSVVGPSMAKCKCGFIIDPTIMFQRSSCCNTNLTKKVFHYVCSNCGKHVKSIFLFDERLFDRYYFREMVARSRQRKRHQAELRKAYIRYRSGKLFLLNGLNFSQIDGFEADLNEFVSGAEIPAGIDDIDRDKEFDIYQYWGHIQHQITSKKIYFSDIIPLYDDLRRDRARCFVALVFMEHERQVWMTEYDDDILVEKYEAHIKG